jgi:hypothetical protein
MRKLAVMKLNHRILAVVVLAACAGSLAQADARQRGTKHATNAAGHVGQPHRPPGTTYVRANPSTGASVSRNAIGLATAPAGIAPGATPNGTRTGASAVVNPGAVGVRAGVSASTPSVPAGAAKIGPVASPASGVRAVAPFVPVQAHVGSISGTGIARPGSAPATIGGPARVAGGLGGPAMKQKR